MDGDENKESVTVVTPNKGVFGNPTFQIGQEVDSFCSNILEGTHMGLVDVL
jgi:hypothetical protein